MEFPMSLTEHKLTPEQYCRLLELLDGDPPLRTYVEDKVRYADTSNRTSVFTRLPS